MSPPTDTSGGIKCGHDDASTDKIVTSGTRMAKLFAIQNRSFQTITCTNCGYTERYHEQSKGNMLDLFFG